MFAEPVATGPGAVERVVRGAGVVLGVTASAVITGWLVGLAASSVAHEKTAAWIIGRSAGITSYLLLVALVVLGLVLSHPARARFSRPSTAVRLRAHVSLAVFTLTFVVLHIVVLATDEYAGVGWSGALVPMGSTYRPVPVTLGVIALWAGLLAGLTASLAGRIAGRIWWPIHKVSIVVLLLVWAHSMLAGSDTTALLLLYAITGAGVLGLAVSRYVSRTPADRRDEYLEATSGREGR